MTITDQATATRPRTEDELDRQEPPHVVRTDPLIDLVAAETAVGDLLDALGRDPSSEHLAGTPRRVAAAWAEMLTPEAFHLTTFANNEGYDELVLARDIPLRSLCEHHLFPFHGVAHVGYLPAGRVLGLSKLARVVDRFEGNLGVGVEAFGGATTAEQVVPGIWAAGDVANAFHPVLGRRVRLEHWSAALNQGPVAAKNMLGQQVSYDKIPHFFSDQYDLGMEYSGLATEWDQIVYRGNIDKREVIVFWLEHGRVAAGMNLNVWDVADHIAALVATKRPVDGTKLADPSIDLDTFVSH